MKIEYDPLHDLLYIWLGAPGEKAARTEWIAPGVHVDFNREGRLIGIEVLDASEQLGRTLSLEVSLTPLPAQTLAERSEASSEPKA
ncbi:MAG: DUF2283 domain-containing protein [Thermoflexus sp.]|jgi:uncharacterized protein YuzE|nr:DUF2283 domain-containing protein [Thermoflexus sp.]